MYNWRDAQDCSYYYIEETGLIVGQVHSIAHTNIYLAKIIKQNEEAVIGRFINCDSAKRAIDKFWVMEYNTLIEDK